MAFDFSLLRSGGLVDAAKAGTGGQSQPAHVSTKGNRFTAIDDQGNETPLQTLYLDCVIVGANPIVSRVYYEGPYTDEKRAPDCFSDNGIAPSAEAQTPQNTTCQGCPRAVWGSAIGVTGKGVPACKSKKKLAIIWQGALYQFVVPPGSLGNLGDYMDRFRENPEMQLNRCITRIEFDGKKQGILNFAATSYYEDEATGILAYQVQEGQVKLDRFLGLGDKGYTGPIKTITTPKTVQLPAPKTPVAPMVKPIEERIVTLKPEPEVAPPPQAQPPSELELLKAKIAELEAKPARKPRALKAKEDTMTERMYPGIGNGAVAGVAETKTVGDDELMAALEAAKS